MHAHDVARRTLRNASFVTPIAIPTGPAWAGSSGDDPLSVRLNGVYADARSSDGALTAAQALGMQESQEEAVSESTAISTYDQGDSWGLKGP